MKLVIKCLVKLLILKLLTNVHQNIKLLVVLLQAVTLCEGSLQRKVFNNTQNFRIHNAEDADAGEFPFVVRDKS